MNRVYSMTGAFRRGMTLIGISASIATLIFSFEKFYEPASKDARFGLLLLAIFSGCLLLFIIVQEYRFSRKARYAEALAYLHQACQLCQEGALNEFPEEHHISNQAKLVCNQLSTAFSLITGTRCSVCIKVLNREPIKLNEGIRDIAVSTLCRDENSKDRQTRGKVVIHSLDKNTDFLEIFKNLEKPLGGVFICNNLPARHEYNNTSFDYYDKLKEVPIPIIRTLVRRILWPLPYKSTVGAAIYPMNPSENDKFVGFLFVDSRSRNVFCKRYDVSMVRSISSALHPMIMKWTEIIVKKKEVN